MPSPRALVIGLDGVPHSLLRRLLGEGVLPHFARLVERGSLGEMRTSLPPISNVAWTSFATGRNPAKHGVYGFTDRRAGTYELAFPNSGDIRAETIWEHLARHGKRSVVINVPGTYPARPMNGVLVAGFVAVKLERAVHPPAALAPLQQMGYRVDVDASIARTDKARFFDELYTTHERRAAAFRHFMTTEAWDLAVAIVTGTDRLMHWCWDAVEDPRNPLADRALEYFRRVDATIGDLVSIAGEGTAVLGLSDHGFCGIRQEVFLNRWLVERGYARFRTEAPTTIADLDPAATRAYAMDPGRIYVNVRGREPQGIVAPEEASALAGEIASALAKLEDGGAPAIERVWTREEAYRGPLAAKGPDLVAIGRRGYDLKGNVSSKEVFRKGDLTGMHTWDDAFAFTTEGRVPEGGADIVDLFPTVCRALGVPVPDDVDGKAFF